MSQSLPVGSRVRFTAYFTNGGEEFDPRSVTATVDYAGRSKTHTMANGVMRAGLAKFHIDHELPEAGEFVVTFETSAGDSQRATFDVTDPEVIDSRQSYRDRARDRGRPDGIERTEDVKTARDRYIDRQRNRR